jgi:DNA-binding transcriptional regulator PaaX
MPRSLRNYSHSFLLFAFIDNLTAAFSSESQWLTKKHPESYQKYRQTAYRLRRGGFLEISKTPSGQKFLKLTRKGELELLVAKAWLPKIQTWDGKWRMFMFDIPRESNNKRDKLRSLLKNHNFFKLQASIYITPYPLNREAIAYLKSTGLINFIRMGRLDELDDDQDLIKHFKLHKPS